MRTDVNSVKLFAPELIPEPLRLNGTELEQYTKKLYDYLRRLQSAWALILNNLTVDMKNIGASGPVIVYNEWIKFTQTVSKTTVDSRDWRGRILRVQILQITDTVANANKNQWSAADINPRVVKAGSTYYNGGVGGDVDILQTLGTGANDATISLQEDTGVLQVRCDGFTSEWQVEILVEGFEQRSSPDHII